ncbi:MAG TPA: glycosyltransferase family 4 protein [Puia sp.]|nr:glycosyltransferase family 4 protein [Puia sp.]
MPSKKSIAFVANTSWSIYKFRLYLIKQLIQQGFAIHVLAPRDQHTVLFEELPGLTYTELTKFRGKSLSPLHDWQLFRELRGHYRRIRPDLIFHYTIKANIYGTLAAARVQCPSVSVITGLGYAFAGSPLLQASVKTVYRRVLQKNAETWFLNSDDQDFFLQEKLVRPETAFLLPGEGVDTDLYAPSPYTTGKESVTFLLIARIIRHKGIYEFIQAAELLTQKGLAVQLQLLGFFDEGNPVAISPRQIEEWTRQYNITYLGHTDHVAGYIEQADCIVLPSYREGMPLSLLEGASMCKALIATDTAGCREVIRDGVNGYLCRKKDGADLAEKMEKYYRLSPEEKRQMGIEGRKRILQHFTKEIITGIYLDKINRLSRQS